MAEIEVTCQISCQKCGWNVGATILTNKANVLDEVLEFIKGCWTHHSNAGLAGELLVVWEPLKSEGR